MPVLASSTAPTTTGGTANILDYKVETVVVPTTLKIVLNPKGYDITTKYVKATAFDADTVYYEKKADGSYAKMNPQPTVFAAGTDYYTAVTADDPVVSLNYGIANKSTGAKNVKVDFAATYTAVDGKKAITFVDSAAKAQAYNASTNAEGAKSGEHKMYLAVASATALPTANTYVKTADSVVQSGKTYYTKDTSGNYTAESNPQANSMGTYYEATTTIGTEITAAELSDVTMTKATAGNKAFAKGTTNQADASIAYNLGAATYALKEGEVIDFTTTQSQLANKLELSAIGGVAGFTLIGEINADADWSEADATAIVITPTYTITNAIGTETALTGTHNQVNLGPQLSVTADGLFTVTGLTSTDQFKSLTATYQGAAQNMNEERGTWSPSAPTSASTGTFTYQLGDGWMTALAGQSTTVTLTYTSGGTDKTVVKTVTIQE